MDLDEIKRGLRAEIKKRENEQYATFQCNVRQMCKDVLAKLEEQEVELAEKDAKILALDAEVFEQKHHAKLFFDERNYAETQLRKQKFKRCLDKAKWCFTKSNYHFVLARHGENGKENNRRSILYAKWYKRWLEIADKFKEAK